MRRLLSIFYLLSSAVLMFAQNPLEHTIASGETLQSIAKHYGITVEELKHANPGLDEYLFTGMVLKLPTSVTASTLSSENITKKELTIVEADSLYDVIFLKDGSEILAKVLDVGIVNIKFEQYDTDEPFEIGKGDVKSVKYGDGQEIDFTVPTKKTNQKKKK